MMVKQGISVVEDSTQKLEAAVACLLVDGNSLKLMQQVAKIYIYSQRGSLPHQQPPRRITHRGELFRVSFRFSNIDIEQVH